MRSIRSWSL